jgi:hypothetical protein
MSQVGLGKMTAILAVICLCLCVCLQARLYRQSVHEVLIAIYEAVTERVLGRTYALQAYPEYRAFFLARSA